MLQVLEIIICQKNIGQVYKNNYFWVFIVFETKSLKLSSSAERMIKISTQNFSLFPLLSLPESVLLKIRDYQRSGEIETIYKPQCPYPLK